jgi:hypothetical protein
MRGPTLHFWRRSLMQSTPWCRDDSLCLSGEDGHLDLYRAYLGSLAFLRGSPAALLPATSVATQASAASAATRAPVPKRRRT